MVSIARDIIWRSIWQITLGGAFLGLILSIAGLFLAGLVGVAIGFALGCVLGLAAGTFEGLCTGLLVERFADRSHQKTQTRLLIFLAMLLPLVSCVGLPLILVIPDISMELRDAHAMYHTGPISFSILAAAALIGVITAALERRIVLRYLRLL